MSRADELMREARSCEWPLPVALLAQQNALLERIVLALEVQQRPFVTEDIPGPVDTTPASISPVIPSFTGGYQPTGGKGTPNHPPRRR